MKTYYIKLGTVPATVQLRRAYKLRPGLNVQYREVYGYRGRGWGYSAGKRPYVHAPVTVKWQDGIVENVDPIRISRM